MWVQTDQVHARLSGKAEFYGIIDGAARGLLTKHVMEEFGHPWKLVVETDSTAARGMCSRAGVGRVRHIQLRWLWIQDTVKSKELEINKIPTLENEADMGTKAHEPKQHDYL